MPYTNAGLFTLLKDSDIPKYIKIKMKNIHVMIYKFISLIQFSSFSKWTQAVYCTQITQWVNTETVGEVVPIP